jgi:hypothetical protein
MLRLDDETARCLVLIFFLRETYYVAAEKFDSTTVVAGILRSFQIRRWVDLQCAICVSP